jgi:hypothetical protein
VLNTATDTTNDHLGALVHEARHLLEMIDDFARRAHVVTGPLEREVRIAGAIPQSSEDEPDPSEVLDKRYPNREILARIMWEIESRALAAMSDFSDITATPWLDAFDRETEEALLLHPDVPDKTKAEVIDRWERRARSDEHRRNLEADPDYRDAVHLAGPIDTVEEFRAAATAAGYSEETIARVVRHFTHRPIRP